MGTRWVASEPSTGMRLQEVQAGCRAACPTHWAESLQHLVMARMQQAIHGMGCLALLQFDWSLPIPGCPRIDTIPGLPAATAGA